MPQLSMTWTVRTSYGWVRVRESAAVSEDEWRGLEKRGRQAIKGLRWMLGMHARHLSKKQSRFLNALRASHRRIHCVWVLKDEFDHVWHFKKTELHKVNARR